MKLALTYSFVLGFSVLNPIFVQAASSPTPAADMDADSAKSFTALMLAPTGEWLAYAVGPQRTSARGGELTVIARSLRDQTERRFPVGHSSSGAGKLKMSSSGRWIAFQTTPVARGDDGNSTLDLAVVELNSGSRKNIRGVQDFSFVGDTREALLVRPYTSVNDKKSFRLSIHPLDGSAVTMLENVTAHTLNPSATVLVWATPESLQTYDFSSHRKRVLDRSPSNLFEQWTWSDLSGALAVFRRTNPTDAAELIVMRELQTPRPKVSRFSPTSWREWPAGYQLLSAEKSAIQSDRYPSPPKLQWRRDEKGLFLGLEPTPQRMELMSGVPNLVLWHSRDERTPGERELMAKRTPADWGYLSLESGKLLRLTRGDELFFTPHAQGRYALAYGLTSYGSANLNAGNGSSSRYQLRDYLLIDLQNGHRRSLPRGIPVQSGLGAEPQLSPAGRYFLYKDAHGDYVAYDVIRHRTRNLTASLPTKFYDDANDPKSGRTPKEYDGYAPHLQGWTADERYVLLSDYRDVWALSPSGASPINLTEDGKRKDISYGRTAFGLVGSLFSVHVSTPVDLTTPMFFGFFDHRTGEVGVARWTPGQDGVRELHREFANVSYLKAAHADAYVYFRTSAAEEMSDLYLAGTDRRPQQQLTDVYSRKPKAIRPAIKYLTYKTSRGDTRHALLRLPTTFVVGQRYPTIVTIYKARSGAVHSVAQDLEARLLEHGYAVLAPDIYTRLNEPGPAAMESVMGAVDAAIASGIVDADRLGLTGHSYGGYETAYIVTQTSRFKAAVPYAGMTNLWSNYGEVNGWQPNPILMEHNQPYMAGPWWDHWDAYLKNSPLYHVRSIETPLLIVHGSNDSAVDFSHAIQLFTTLQRLGSDSTVLLEYVGEEHDLTYGDGAAQRDFEERLIQFFDHFLRGSPAPTWWAEGISRYAGSAPPVSSAEKDTR